jgi:hypothetical protein
MLLSLVPVLALLGQPAAKPPAGAQGLTAPLVVWSGQYPAPAPVKSAGEVATELIGTEQAWARFWKARRAGEQLPRLDFARVFVAVATQPGVALDSLHLGPDGRHPHALWWGAWEGRTEGVGYVAGVFARDGVADIGGRPLPR